MSHATTKIRVATSAHQARVPSEGIASEGFSSQFLLKRTLILEVQSHRF